jgi:hypothetical protein
MPLEDRLDLLTMGCLRHRKPRKSPSLEPNRATPVEALRTWKKRGGMRSPWGRGQDGSSNVAKARSDFRVVNPGLTSHADNASVRNSVHSSSQVRVRAMRTLYKHCGAGVSGLYRTMPTNYLPDWVSLASEVAPQAVVRFSYFSEDLEALAESPLFRWSDCGRP